MKQDIEKRIRQDNNNYLAAWMPLDYAQAYLVIGEVEESIKELEQFYSNMNHQLQLPLGFEKVVTHMRKMHAKGYGSVQAVRDFEESLS